MMSSKDAVGTETVFGVPRVDRWVFFAGFPALALAVGALVPALARWALSLNVVLPVRFAFRLVGAIDAPVEIAVNLAFWLVAGLAFGFLAMSESVTVVVDDDEVRVEKDRQAHAVRRRDVSAVFADARELVVLDQRSRPVVREQPAVPAAVMAEAFRRHGYPWRDGDPHAALWRSWTLGDGELPPPAHALLAVRETAVKRKSTAEIRDLRIALEGLGFTIRDEGSRQHWRPLI